MPLPFFIPPIEVPDEGVGQYMLNRERKHKKDTFIAKGSYGIVYHDPTVKNKVIKLYSPIVNVNEEIEKADKMVKRTGNERQRLTKVNLRRNNVPYNALKQYQSLNASNSFMKNIPFRAVQMPNVGINLVTYMNHPTFYLSEHDFLTQTQKLIHQIALLYQHNESHGDVRAENIMIDPSHLTLVDFDLLGTYEQVAERFQTGIHKHVLPSWVPPEFLVLQHKERQQERYAHSLYQRHVLYFQSKGILSAEMLLYRINEANVKNKEYIMEHHITLVDAITYLDNFGLALSLLELLTVHFPQSNHQTINNTRNLLEKMAQFELSTRILPDQAEHEMNSIFHRKEGGRMSRRIRRTRHRTKKNHRAYKN